MFRTPLIRLSLSSLVLLASSGMVQGQDIPPELLEDEHFREEFGVNNLTTPSIRKIFGELDDIGQLPYDEAQREIPSKTPTDRAQLALSMGGLIADGFFVVHSGKLKDLEDVGRAILKHAAAMAAGDRITSHTKSLLEHSTNGEMELLKEELARTQADVEAEMILLRDIDAVHLIGFGGWLRAFEVACAGALLPEFSAEEAEILKRVDIADYYVYSFSTLEPRLLEKENIATLVADLNTLMEMIDLPEETPFTEEQVVALNAHVRKMADLSFAPLVKPAEPASLEGEEDLPTSDAEPGKMDEPDVATDPAATPEPSTASEEPSQEASDGN